MDQYGNPTQHHTGGGPLTGAGYGAQTGTAVGHGGATGYAGTGGGQQQPMRPDQKDNHGMLHRSGSSSSSEDDEQGGRRKKGMAQKIKEKLPGGQKTEEEQCRHQAATGTGTNTTARGYGRQGGAVHEPEKKEGMMQKIKEKLPGEQ